MGYRLVVFDFDNTLVRLDVDWKAAKADIVALARENGIGVDQGQNIVPLSNRLSAHHGLKAEVDAIYRRHEMECAQSRSYSPLPRIIAIAKELKAKGVKTAIASGNHTDSIKRILSEMGEAGTFDFVCGRDAAERSKPAPDQLLLLIGKAGARKEDVLFVGDSSHDVNSAKAAGVFLFLVRPDSSFDAARLRHLLGLPKAD